MEDACAAMDLALLNPVCMLHNTCISRTPLQCLHPLISGEHNPVEDARAAMDLALLKFERGPAYAAGGGERGDKLAEVLNDAGRCAEAAG